MVGCFGLCNNHHHTRVLHDLKSTRASMSETPPPLAFGYLFLHSRKPGFGYTFHNEPTSHLPRYPLDRAQSNARHRCLTPCLRPPRRQNFKLGLPMARGEDRGVGGLDYDRRRPAGRACSRGNSQRAIRSGEVPVSWLQSRMIACSTRKAVHGNVERAVGTTIAAVIEIAGRPALPVCSPFGGGSSSAIRCTSGASGSFAMRRLRSKARSPRVFTTSLFE